MALAPQPQRTSLLDQQRRLKGEVRVAFELHSLHGDVWLLVREADDLRQLEPVAAQLVDRGEVDGVRIARRRTHVDHDFVSSVIIRKRLRPGAADNDPLQGANPGRDYTWCDGVEDLIGDAQRQVFRALFARYLDENRLTPLEILHHERHARALDNAGTLVQGALQRLASRQVRGTQQSAVARMKELMALVEDAMAALTARARATPPEPLAPGGFKALVERLRAQAGPAGGAADGREAMRAVRAAVYRAIAEYLIAARSWVEKLDRLFQLYEPTLTVTEIRFIDSLAAEILASPLALRELAGEQADRLALILNAIDLYVGDLGRAGDLPQGVRVLSTLLADGLLPRTQAELRQGLLRHLYARQPLRADRADKGLLQEMTAIDAISRHLKERTPTLAKDEEILDLLAGAAERLIQPEAVADLMAGSRSPSRRLDALLGVLEIAPGAGVKARLAPYLRSLLTVDDLVRDWAGAAGRIDAIRPLCALAARLDASGLPRAVRHEMLEMLDTGLYDILRVDLVGNQAMPFVDRMLVLIRDGGKLPEGRARVFAAETLSLAFKRPEFLLHYLERFPDAAGKRAAYMQLYTDLREGGLVPEGLMPMG